MVKLLLKNFTLSLIIGFCFSPLWLWSQKILVKGTVLDDETTPAEFVEVIGNNGEKMVFTDEKGNYVLELTRRDTIILEFRSIGRESKIIKIAVPPNANEIVHNISLKVTAVTMGVVTITEKFQEQLEKNTLSIEAVSSKRLDQFAAVDIINAMTMVPGITIYDEQPSIRGSSGYTYGAGSRVLTLLNGLPMVTADRGSVNFDMLPTDNIKQIEIFKGAASVLYGTGAMGGVINVITDDPKETPRTSIRFRTGMFDRPPNPEVEWAAPRNGLSSSLHFFHSRRIKENFDFTTQVDLIYREGYRLYENSTRGRALIMAKYRVPSVTGLSIGLNTQYLIDSTGLVIAWKDYPKNGLKPRDGFLSYNFLHRISIDPYISYLGKRSQHLYQGRIFAAISYVTTGRGPDASNQDNTSVLYFNEYQYKTSFLDDNLQMIAGVNYTRSVVQSKGVYGNGVGNQLSTFLQFKYEWSKFNFVVGARYQYEDVEGDTSITRSPETPKKKSTTMNDPIFRVGINYQPAKATYLRISWGQALRSPSVAERFTSTFAGPLQVLPSPGIRIERGYSAEVGIKQLYKFNKIKGFIDAAAFTMQFKDMVEFWADQSRFTAFRAQNVSRASINGFEINGNLESQITPKFNVFFSGGVTYVDPRDLNGDPEWEGDAKAELSEILLRFSRGGRDNPVTLKYRNRWLVRSNLQLSYSKFSFTTNYSYTSHMVNVDKVFLLEQFFPGTKAFRAVHNKGWHLVDFIFAYQISKNIISFHIFNVFNTEYVTIPGTLGEHRNFAIQYKIEF
ncbi:MAG: TonB-dependent receptor [Bacteroidia bacterium]|nr:TonB-dependent receptor [Bacteroidia bacterium]MDW8158621.1 TonB-dependent receptor [Bacteroidia bacterium]